MIHDGIIRIAMWSGPRNISTAIMRAFENRADCAVWDEPFYAHYLSATGLNHPMAKEIIAAYETDWEKVAKQASGPVPCDKKIFYQKHMTHHILPHIDVRRLKGIRHAFLIRDPSRVILSYTEKRTEVTLEDLGLPQQHRLFEIIWDDQEYPPPVLDSEDLLRDPRTMSLSLCAALGIEFDPAMLSWPKGRRQSDGLWAAHWYGSVERSTGYLAPSKNGCEVPENLQELLKEANIYYQALRIHRLKVK